MAAGAGGGGVVGWDWAAGSGVLPVAAGSFLFFLVFDVSGGGMELDGCCETAPTQSARVNKSDNANERMDSPVIKKMGSLDDGLQGRIIDGAGGWMLGTQPLQLCHPESV